MDRCAHHLPKGACLPPSSAPESICSGPPCAGVCGHARSTWDQCRGALPPGEVGLVPVRCHPHAPDVRHGPSCTASSGECVPGAPIRAGTCCCQSLGPGPSGGTPWPPWGPACVSLVSRGGEQVGVSCVCSGAVSLWASGHFRCFVFVFLLLSFKISLYSLNNNVYLSQVLSTRLQRAFLFSSCVTELTCPFNHRPRMRFFFHFFNCS